MTRKLQNYIDRFGPEVGPKLYHVLQSQAAHAGVCARRRRLIEDLRRRGSHALPLFPELEPADSRS